MNLNDLTTQLVTALDEGRDTSRIVRAIGDALPDAYREQDHADVLINDADLLVSEFAA